MQQHGIRCSHELTFLYDFDKCATIIQHGNNPEARLILTDHEYSHISDIASKIQEWVDRIHTYEEASSSSVF